jgi:hypothetical protein
MAPISWPFELLIFAVLSLEASELASGKQQLDKLGSANFAQRTAADQWFRDHPLALPVLRQAIPTADLETKRRAKVILDFHALRRGKYVEVAIEAGRIQDVIRVLGSWPNGEGDDEAWRQLWQLTRKIADSAGKKHYETIRFKLFDDSWAWSKNPKIVTEGLPSDLKAAPSVLLWARGRDAIWRHPDRTPPTYMTSLTVSGPVDIQSRPVRLHSWAIFADGPVKIGRDIGCSVSIIVSTGDVHVEDQIGGSVILARGKINCSGAGRCILISGQSVHVGRGGPTCNISENDLNPLGFIRWADAPNAKPPSKTK